MNGLFSYDNPVIRGVNKVVDFVCLTLLWWFFSIPIITLGASTAAFYYTFNKTICRDNGYIWRSFWRAFKENIKLSTILFLVQLIIYVIVFFNCYATLLLYETVMLKFVCWIIWGFSIVIVMWTCCWIPYSARFNDSIKIVIKNSAVMTLMNLHWSILVFAMFTVSIVLMNIFIFAFLLTPALYLAGSCWAYEKVFRKYSILEENEVMEEVSAIGDIDALH